MKRALALVLCCCALAVGCDRQSDTAAATVDGATVTTREVVDELNAINANQTYLQQLDDQFKQQGQNVVGAKTGTFDAGFVNQVLRRQMQFALMHSEVQRRGLTATPDCQAAARNGLMSDLGSQDPQAGQTLFNSFPADYQTQLQGWYVDQFLLQADLANQPCGSPTVAQQYFDAHQADFTQNCVSIIQVDDQNLANSIVTQARAGTDFTTLAQQNSIDSQTAAQGGDAGCHIPLEFSGTMAPAVQAAPVGGVTDPIQIADPNTGDQSYIVLKVTDRKPSNFSDVQTAAQQLAESAQSVELGTWLQHAQDGAHVTVDPRYGTFDASTFSITPPAGSSPPSTAPGPADTSSTPQPSPAPETPSPGP